MLETVDETGPVGPNRAPQNQAPQNRAPQSRALWNKLSEALCRVEAACRSPTPDWLMTLKLDLFTFVLLV